MQTTVEHKIDNLSAEAKKVFLAKLKQAVNLNKDNTVTNSRKRIVAYVQGNSTFSVDTLKTNLKKKLPDYMMPSQIVSIKEMPLLPNGKINRSKLSEASLIPKLANIRANDSTITTDNKTTTQALINIWEEVIGFAPITAEDNFFEIGGDSILSIQIVAKARAQGIILKSNDIFEYQTIGELTMFAQTEKTPLKNNAETKLTKIWEEVLGFAPIHRDDNFFEIGGDSILSIQIIAKARNKGIELKTNDIFDHQTIGELVLFAKTKETVHSNELVIGELPLLPIQHWFFEDHKVAPHFWNQGVQFSNISEVNRIQLQQVTAYLLEQHDALRQRFVKTEKGWIAEILPPENLDVFTEIILESNDQSSIEEHTKSIQESFDLSKGNLIQCVYFKTPNLQDSFCRLIAHHLLVDAISWKIITEDFTNALIQAKKEQPIISNAKTSSVIAWSQHIKNTVETTYQKEADFWKKQIAKSTSFPVDFENSKTIEHKDLRIISTTLDATVTKALVNTANKTFSTKTLELLVAGLIETIGQWSAQKEISIGFEGHGRETKNTNLDISKTVGWFTSYFPVTFEYRAGASIDDKIVAVKENMRKVPNGGIGFGALRYIEKSFGTIKNPEILFNFLGTYNFSELQEGLTVSALTEGLRDERSERSYKLEINSHIQNDILYLNWSYSTKMYKEVTIQRLVDNFNEHLTTIIDHCTKNEDTQYTPSDFPEANLSQDDLNNLLDFLD